MPTQTSLMTDPPGILKNKLNGSCQDMDTLSQISKQVRSLEKRKTTKAATQFNWKRKQDRMALY